MVCSTESPRSRSPSSHHSSRRSGSRGPSHDRSYSERSHSRTRSFSDRSHSRSGSRSHSRSRSKSRSAYSRSRSHSWSRSRSRSRVRSTYSSRSRSGSRSSSRSGYRAGRRQSYFRSRSRSHTYESRLHSRSRSRSRSSRHSSSNRKGKDPRDRSKRVKWTNNVWIVGERTKDTIFHFCDICDLPIVIYGRLLPCKHVLCYTCAMNLPNKCNRCQKSVQTVERCLVGGIFMCFENENCRRTYLSQRDLQAHIDHRHKSSANAKSGAAQAAKLLQTVPTIRNDPNNNLTMDSSKPKQEDNGSGKSVSTCSISSTASITPSKPQITVLPSLSNPNGLLPLPTERQNLANRMPLGLPCPVMPPNSNYSQFSNPIPMTNTSIPPPNFMPGGVMPPVGPTVSSNSSNVSAVAALAAAAVSAATLMNAQSNSSVNSRATSSFQPTATLASNALQTNPRNVSLISSVLRTPSPQWGCTPNSVSNSLLNLGPLAAAAAAAAAAAQSQADMSGLNNLNTSGSSTTNTAHAAANNRRLPFL